MDSEPSISGKEEARIEVDLGIYSLDTVIRATYKFTGRAYVHVQPVRANVVEVLIRPKVKQDFAPDRIAGEFGNELVDQRLRQIVADETREERDRILALALERTALIPIPTIRDESK